MDGHIDALRIRATYGRTRLDPPRPYGPGGWVADGEDGGGPFRIIATAYGGYPGARGQVWLHASISRPGTMPTYTDLADLHKAVWGTTGYAYQVFAPTSKHINIHPYALHLFGLAGGGNALPDFTAGGTSI